MIGTIFQLAGSLGVFLFGMRVMSEGIQKSAGDRLHRILGFMTNNRVSAVFTGFIITALVQSSSATTVLVVSFANAGLLNLTQSIGVIMGANIGTTVTGWIVALVGFNFKITAIALPVIGIGLPLLLSKRIDRPEWGEVATGFGLLFLGLDFLKKTVPDLKSNPEILEFLSRYTEFGFGSFLIFIFVGTLLTIIVQSSSAAMAITLTMAHFGWIDFQTSAAIVLGENIGTTVTAFLASLGTDVNARQAARAHTLFNLAGVVWMAFLFYPFISMVDALVPGPREGAGITAHLAMFHTMFNICNVLIFIWFVPHIARGIERLVKPRDWERSKTYQLQFISTTLQDTPELNLLTAQRELSRMTKIVEEMFTRFIKVFQEPFAKLGSEVEELKELEDYTDQMQEQISAYLAECGKENLTDRAAADLGVMLRIVNELESIGDSCYNLILLAARRHDKKIALNQKAELEITPYTDTVTEFLAFIRQHLDEKLGDLELERAFALEKKINSYRDSFKKKAQKRLQKGSDVKGELLLMDFVRHIEHIGDFCLNIAQSLRNM